MIYRRATLADIDELVACRLNMRLEREDNKNIVDHDDFRKRTYDYFRKHIPDESFISWIALNEGKIVATSGLCFYLAPPTYKNLPGITAYITNMYTKPEYRKRGIATKLLEYLIDEARGKNCKKVTLNASSAGRAIYEKFGFESMEDEMFMYID